jgi:pimeloyl-ACP methyl ester carboxylesterase
MIKYILLGLLIIGLGLSFIPAEQQLPISVSEGNASTIIIAIHGSPGTKADFTDLSKTLDAQIHAIDMPGFGDGPLASSYGIDDNLDYVLGYMDSRGIVYAQVLGYSWGGGVAMHLAEKYPERFTRLLLVDSWGILEGEATGSHFGEQLRYSISYPFVAIYPGSLWNSFQNRNGFLRSYMDSDLRPMPDVMKNISVQTFVIQGTNDTVVPMFVAQNITALIPNATLLTYNGSHGSIFFESYKIAEVINDIS